MTWKCFNTIDALRTSFDIMTRYLYSNRSKLLSSVNTCSTHPVFCTIIISFSLGHAIYQLSSSCFLQLNYRDVTLTFLYFPWFPVLQMGGYKNNRTEQKEKLKSEMNQNTFRYIVVSDPYQHIFLPKTDKVTERELVVSPVGADGVTVTVKFPASPSWLLLIVSWVALMLTLPWYWVIGLSTAWLLIHWPRVFPPGASHVMEKILEMVCTVNTALFPVATSTGEVWNCMGTGSWHDVRGSTEKKDFKIWKRNIFK